MLCSYWLREGLGLMRIKVKGNGLSFLFLLVVKLSLSSAEGNTNEIEYKELINARKKMIFYNETTDWRDLNLVITKCLGGENSTAYYYSISNNADQLAYTVDENRKKHFHLHWPVIPLRTLSSSFYTDSTEDPIIIVLFVRNESFLMEVRDMVDFSVAESAYYFDYTSSTDDFSRTGCDNWTKLSPNVKGCHHQLKDVERDFYIMILLSSSCNIGIVEQPSNKSGFHFYTNIIKDNFDFLKECAFTTNAHGYGRMTDNGKYTGLMGDLIDNKLGMIFSVRPTTTRMHYVDFTIPMEYDAQIYIYNDEQEVKHPNISFLFLPYELEVWIAIILCYVTCSFLVHLLSFNIKSGSFQWSLYDSTLYFYQALVMQPGSSRMIRFQGVWKFVGLWWFFTMIITTGYGAKFISFITSSITNDHHVDDLESLGDMIAKQGYKVGTVRNTLTHFSLLNQIREYHNHENRAKKHVERENPYYELMHHISNTSEQMEYCDTVEEGMQKVLSEKYVFIGSENAIEVAMTTLNITKKTHFDQERLLGTIKSVALRKGSKLLVPMNKAFRKNQEQGLYSKWVSKIEKEVQANKAITTDGVQREEEEDSVEEYSSLDLQSVLPIIRLHLYLSLITVFVCLCENIFYKCRSYNESRGRRRRKRKRAFFRVRRPQILVHPTYADDPMGLRLIRDTIRRKNRLEMEYYLNLPAIGQHHNYYY